MTPPPLATSADVAMLLLTAIHTGHRLDAQDGRLTLQVGDSGAAVIDDLDAALDTLEAKAWVDLTRDPPVLTGTGKYWLNRMLKQAGWKHGIDAVVLVATESGGSR